MSIKINRGSLRETIRKARFPRDMNITDIEKGIERDAIEALIEQGVTDGIFDISLGSFNYDIVVDSHGKRRFKRLKKY